MTSIIEKDNSIILTGDKFDLKIDNNRKLYIKKKDEKKFSFVDYEVPIGLTSVEKKQLLYKLYFVIESRINGEENV